MKALTLTNPWAVLVAIGAKRMETRSWATKYRGPLAIHAAKGFPLEARKLCLEEPFLSTIRKHFGPLMNDWPFDAVAGHVIAICNVTECLEIRADGGRPSDPELSFGDFTVGRFTWFLRDVRRITPVPARGALGLWDWDAPPEVTNGQG